MARILLAWQYGAGFGHIAQLMPLARELRTRGHEVALVLADKGATRTFWEPEGFEAHQAPGLPPRKAWDYSAPTDTMADVFLLWGYDDAAFMGQIAGMWKETLERLNPDLVICETAPLVNLVAKGRWPTIVIGSGYAVPPAGQPMPTARFWQDEKYPAHSVRAEAVMTEVANRLRRELKLPALNYLSDLFAGDATFRAAPRDFCHQ